MEEFPVLVEGDLEGVAIESVACGRGHTVAITEEGEVYHWGSRTWNYPHHISILSGKRAVQAAGGKTFSMVLTEDGEVYTWSKSSLITGRSTALGHGTKSAQVRREERRTAEKREKAKRREEWRSEEMKREEKR